jgi:transmembrane sensor
MSTTAKNPSNKTLRTARAEASVWIVRLHSEERTPELEAGLREWLAADPENARQFEHITDVWEIGGAVTANGLPRMRSWSAATRPRWTLAAAAAMVCTIAVFTAYWWWAASAYVTDRGEQRLVRLDDGSRVSLNSDTRLRVEFRTTERRVRLERGEGFFEVAKDVRRPFIVQAGDREVTALGTTFVVRHESARTAITLVEGKVAVSPLGSFFAPEKSNPPEKPSASVQPQADTFTLTPGERLTLAKLAPPKIDAPRIDAITAWRRGEVLLEATPLTEAIAEMNRYDERQLVLDNTELATVRVSGVYRTGDSPGFARAVAELHGLKIIEGPDRIHLQR